MCMRALFTLNMPAIRPMGTMSSVDQGMRRRQSCFVWLRGCQEVCQSHCQYNPDLRHYIACRLRDSSFCLSGAPGEMFFSFGKRFPKDSWRGFGRPSAMWSDQQQIDEDLIPCACKAAGHTQHSLVNRTLRLEHANVSCCEPRAAFAMFSAREALHLVCAQDHACMTINSQTVLVQADHTVPSVEQMLKPTH